MASVHDAVAKPSVNSDRCAEATVPKRNRCQPVAFFFSDRHRCAALQVATSGEGKSLSADSGRCLQDRLNRWNNNRPARYIDRRNDGNLPRGATLLKRYKSGAVLRKQQSYLVNSALKIPNSDHDGHHMLRATSAAGKTVAGPEHQ